VTLSTPRVFYGYILVVAAAGIMTLAIGTSTAFGLFFKPVMTEFGWNRATTAGAYSLSWILQGLLAVVMGKLTDRFGPRIVMTLCGSLVALGYLLMSRIDSLGEFYLFFAIVGIGMGGFNVSLVSTVSRWFVRRRGTMTGIVLAGGGFGSLFTPPIANWLIATYDWRLSYVIMGSLIFVIVLLGAQFLRRDPEVMGQRPLGDDLNEKLRAGSASEGLSHGKAIYSLQFWMVFATYFAFGFCAYFSLVHLAPHATDKGVTPSEAAKMLSTIGGAVILGRIGMGSLGDRFGNRKALIFCFSLMSLAFFFLVLVEEMWMLYVFAAFLGFTWGGGTLGPLLLAEIFGLGSLGGNVGVINLGYSFGAGLGPFLAGYLFDVTRSYQPAFLMALFVSLFALVMSFLLKVNSSGIRA
jgi:MFS transporter, OFA family, oxalate/formate antiporter